jgi:hypothetical protein
VARGYDDILKKGYPRPKFRTTILAELYSPITPDFLHGGADDVPFLVSTQAKVVMRKHRLTGFRFSSVEVTKIATKGIRTRKPRGGDPEDQIMKSKNQSKAVLCPELHAVRVVGRLEIIPQYASGRCPHTGYVTPYDLPK